MVSAFKVRHAPVNQSNRSNGNQVTHTLGAHIYVYGEVESVKIGSSPTDAVERVPVLRDLRRECRTAGTGDTLSERRDEFVCRVEVNREGGIVEDLLSVKSHGMKQNTCRI